MAIAFLSAGGASPTPYKTFSGDCFVTVTSSSHLALNGGVPVRSVPFPAWPVVAEDEIAAAANVLRSGKINYWTGDEGKRFEQEYADYVGTKHAIALTNGTV